MSDSNNRQDRQDRQDRQGGSRFTEGLPNSLRNGSAGDLRALNNGEPGRRATGDVKAPFPALHRTGTSVSLHAETSLRRMATHETGGYEHDDDHGLHDEADEEREIDEGRNGGKGMLERHSEEHELETSSERHEESRVESGAGKEEGAKGGVVLQDQTNLLPVRQIIFVFVGLTCAVFCSLLDQTM
jgi:hypothetical protein